jgi:uncharacterized protein YndB with AHSA1/START domain
MDTIAVKTSIQVPVSQVWDYWTGEEHITKWNFAHPDWHCPSARNDLRVGGAFHYTMAAKDDSMSFDFWGTYQRIDLSKRIEIILGDERKMSVYFEEMPDGTLVTEMFEPEKTNPIELQQTGWQMILDNFKRYAEGLQSGI